MLRCGVDTKAALGLAAHREVYPLKSRGLVLRSPTLKPLDPIARVVKADEFISFAKSTAGKFIRHKSRFGLPFSSRKITGWLHKHIRHLVLLSLSLCMWLDTPINKNEIRVSPWPSGRESFFQLVVLILYLRGFSLVLKIY